MNVRKVAPCWYVIKELAGVRESKREWLKSVMRARHIQLTRENRDEETKAVVGKVMKIRAERPKGAFKGRMRSVLGV